jgi:iron complex transport system substrate-binding protein
VDQPLRIVPLIASATEMVHALGLGEFQVGRSHECDFPPSVLDLPVCTRPRIDTRGSSQEIDQQVRQTLAAAATIYEILDDVLIPLAPTHLLTQTHCEVCAVSLKDVEAALAGRYPTRPAVVALEPNSLADIWTDIRRVAAACSVPERGEELVATLQARMAATAASFRSLGRRPRVACIEWHEPLMAAGNWIPELVTMLGAVNLFGSPGKHSPWLDWRDLAAADPDVIISMPCGFSLARTEAEMYWLEQNPVWPQLTAVREGRVFVADGNRFFTRPGPGVADSLDLLAGILRDDRDGEPGVWRRFLR